MLTKRIKFEFFYIPSFPWSVYFHEIRKKTAILAFWDISYNFQMLRRALSQKASKMLFVAAFSSQSEPRAPPEDLLPSGKCQSDAKSASREKRCYHWLSHWSYNDSVACWHDY